MKTYELNAEEINLVLEALRYVKLHAYGGELRDGEVDEYYALCALIDMLDPKPVKQKKQGWMVVWDGNNQYCKTSVLEDRAEALKLLGAMGGYPNVRLVEVTWEV